MADIVASVEYVEVSITAATEPVTVNLTKGQDETQCVPFYSVRNTGTITDQHQDRMAEITFVDNAGTPAVVVSASARVDNDTTIFQVFVVEFVAAITVFQITVTGFDDGVASAFPIFPSDAGEQSAFFCIYSYQYTDPQTSDDDFDDACVRVRVNGTLTDRVILDRFASAGAVNGTLYVVVAGSTEFIVEHSEFNTPGPHTAATVTDTIASTVEADTFLVVSYQVAETSDDMQDGAWQMDLQDSTTVRARRGDASPSGQDSETRFAIQVVECQDSEWDVQRNDVLTLSATSITDAITAIDQDRSIINCLDHTGHPYSVGRNDSTQGNDIDDIQSAADFSSDSLVRYRKRGTAVDTDIVSYEVIQFVLPSPPPAGDIAPILAVHKRAINIPNVVR